MDFGGFWICYTRHLKEQYPTKIITIAICFRSNRRSPGLIDEMHDVSREQGIEHDQNITV